MNIEVKEVVGNKDICEFINLPERIHKNHKNWLHPLRMDDKKYFNKDKNRLFHHNKAKLWIALKNGEVVGRVMGVIPIEYNKIHNENYVRFSFIETYENYEVFAALLDKVSAWGKENACTGLLGPLAFSDKDPQGFLIQGFEEQTVMITNHSYKYMIDFCRQYGLEPKLDLVQYVFPLGKQIVERLKPFAHRVEKYQNLRLIEFTKTKQIKPYIPAVFNLMNEAYKNIYGYAQVDEVEMHEFANRFLPLLDPKLIKIVLNENNELIAFVVAMADLSDGIRSAKGRLFPFGWIKILRAGKRTNKMMLVLGAIHEEYRGKGIDALMGKHLMDDAINKGLTLCDSHLIMESNEKMRAEIERLDGFKMYKKYRIFEKDI